MIDAEFLDWVVTTPSGLFQLLIGPRPEGFVEEWYEWPTQKDAILKRISQIDDTNVYFSPHLFSRKDSHKEFVIPQTRTLCVDLDNADVSDLHLNPTAMLETSPGRHQGFWVLKEDIPDFETLSKKLSYTIENADHSGWPLGHKFRVPGARNFKYNPSPLVRLVPSLSSERIFTLFEIEEWVANTQISSATAQADDAWIESPPSTSASGPLEIMERYRANLGPKVMAYYDTLQADRSEALWALMVALFRAGASRDEVYWVAKNSVNNKFKEHRYNGDRDLAKDVDRAFKAQTTNQSDVSQMIKIAERAQGTQNDRKRLVTKLVIGDMNRRGEFIYTDDGRYWYLHSNAGRPVQLGRRAEQLEALLDDSYGLNSSDGFQPYVCNHLINHTISKGRRAVSAVMSHYDGSSLLLHSGRQDIYRITPQGTSRHPDGQFGVLFPWRSQNEEVITLDDPICEDWTDWLFEGWFDNLLDFTPEQAKILIRVWTLFILFRDAAVSRPILALLGQQGSGKSTLFHIMYTLFYGRGKSLNAISNPEDFDFLTSSDPVVVFDNVDSFTGWLPDRLALAASASDLTKRKLYTDSDVVTLKRQAILGITAHEPKFGRPDVVDRLIILNFQRRETFSPESALIERVHEARPKLWGSIVRDAQRVLGTPDVEAKDIPNFRISDFARLGARIASALGCLEEFKTIVEMLRNTQVAFSLGEDDIMITALRRFVTMKKTNPSIPEYVSVGFLWEYITQFDRGFVTSFKTSNALARKMVTMEPNLRSMFNITYKYDNALGVRTWKIEEKGGVK